MNCPNCGTELRINHTTNVLKGGKLYWRKHLNCMNKKCSNYNSEVSTEDIEIAMEVEEAEDEEETSEE